MLEVVTDVGAGWKGDTNWEMLAQDAVAAAIEQTPHAEFATMPVRVEISVKLSDDAEVQELNRDYRGKDKPTNVLSFPMVQPDLLDGLSNSDDGEVLLGDIVLARETVTREAADKRVSAEHHATHLIVHGALHLLGYDHEQGEAEAEAMEALERAALAGLGISDPYRVAEA